MNYFIPNGQTLTPTLSHWRGRKYAFTLAEVLITLVIIGVIAAITVPTLITEYQKEQTVTRLKKAYSTLAQTTNRAISDNGPIDTWEVGEVSAEGTKLFLENYIIPYLNILKEPTTSLEGDWSCYWYHLNNEEQCYDNTYVRFYLQDGTSITGLLSVSSETQKRFLFYIDINGDKKPNKQGKDIFQFNYYIFNSSDPELNGKFVPTAFRLRLDRNQLLSSSYSRYTCNKLRTGSYCAALIMKDGWRIADDYPW